MYAKVILDSISPIGSRLTTIEVKHHRFIIQELLTHRVFSRNSSSSRAIPVSRYIESVREDPAIPIQWGTKQRGMQAGPPLENGAAKSAELQWRRALENALDAASILDQMGVHKQITNRLLDPFAWNTMIISSTEWENFFRLRCSPLAQPEIEAVAQCIRLVYEASVPQELDYGEWHTPLIQPDEEFSLQDRKKVSVARCGRVSYLTHAGVRDPDEDLAMFRRLQSAEPPHDSPMEHVATPATPGEIEAHNVKGNFGTFHQLRHTGIA